jgi:hypothetical protein
MAVPLVHATRRMASDARDRMTVTQARWLLKRIRDRCVEDTGSPGWQAVENEPDGLGQVDVVVGCRTVVRAGGREGGGRL